MSKTEINNEIVKLRHLVRKSRVRVIHNLTREIKILRERRGDEKKLAKFQRRAERFHDEVKAAKNIQDDEVTKFAINNDKTLYSILNEPSSNATVRVTAKFADFPLLKEKIVALKVKFPNYEQFLGPGRKKLMKQEMKAAKKELKNKKKNEEETMNEEIGEKDTKKKKKKNSDDEEDKDEYSDDQDQKSEEDEEEEVEDDKESVEKNESEEEENLESSEKTNSDENDVDEEKIENTDNEETDETEDDEDDLKAKKKSKFSKSKNNEKLKPSLKNLQNSPNEKKSTKKEKKSSSLEINVKNKRKSSQLLENSKKGKKQLKQREIHPVSEEATVKRFSELIKEDENNKETTTAKKLKIDTKFHQHNLKKEEDSFFTTADGDRNYMSIVIPKKQISNSQDDHQHQNVGKKFSRSKNESFFSNVDNSDNNKFKDRKNFQNKFEPNRKQRRQRDTEIHVNEMKNCEKLEKKKTEEHLHPSWAAKKKQQDALKIEFQGKKIVFGDE